METDVVLVTQAVNEAEPTRAYPPTCSTSIKSEIISPYNLPDIAPIIIQGINTPFGIGDPIDKIAAKK